MFIEKFIPHFLRSDRQNKIILIIDAHRQDINHTVRTALAGGYNVLKAYDGKEGLQLTCRYKPDLIIVDLNLPDMPGDEFCRRLKTYPQLQEIPIIVLTALNTPEAILNYYEQGIENYFMKPIGKSLLLKEIKRILRENHQTVEI